MVPQISLRIATVAVALCAILPQANAQTRRHYRVYSGAVVLQPFSAYAGRSIATARPAQLAYYAPRPIRAEAPLQDFDREDNDGISDSRSESITSSGSHPTVNGSHAVLRNGIAYAPSNAPERVKSAIWAVNSIRTKPYIWGGGHGSFYDRGYDCSGTVSFALHNAGLLSSPLPSSDLMRYGERGRGRWITVYARNGHTFAMIAGLRLDTTDFRYGGDVGPRWHTDFRDTRGFVANHPPGL